MYGLSANEKLDFLVDRKLIQVCIGEYQVQLHFDDDVSVSSEGRVSIDGRIHDASQSMSAPLAALLGATVTKVTSPGNDDLVVSLSNGSILAATRKAD
ncbi:MAG TPA: hypothetical protein VFF06_34820 [Polyangia bacterium]|nr:hypothetical protein [Polyangia bacterium]